MGHRKASKKQWPWRKVTDEETRLSSGEMTQPPSKCQSGDQVQHPKPCPLGPRISMITFTGQETTEVHQAAVWALHSSWLQSQTP